MQSTHYVPHIADIFMGYACEFRRALPSRGLMAVVMGETKKYSDVWAPCIIGGKSTKDGATAEEKVWAFLDSHMLAEPKIYEVESMLEAGVLRTPYLTRAVIEAEGWMYREHRKGGLYFSMQFPVNSSSCSVNPYPIRWIRFEPHASYIMLSMDKGVETDFYFRGTCPSVNEFRRIMKETHFNESWRS